MRVATTDGVPSGSCTSSMPKSWELASLHRLPLTWTWMLYAPPSLGTVTEGLVPRLMAVGVAASAAGEVTLAVEMSPCARPWDTHLVPSKRRMSPLVAPEVLVRRRLPPIAMVRQTRLLSRHSKV